VYRCSEIVRLISNDEYLTAGVFKKLGIRLHLAMCTHCTRYVRQLGALAAALRRIGDGIATSELEKAKMRILQKLS
jgi:hypothetical protein